MIYIGIDPGKRGGLAAIDEGAEPLLVVPMPVISGRSKAKTEYDLPRIFERLLRQGKARVMIERLGPMPTSKGGVAANYQRGYSMGMLQAFCTALKLPWELVSPSVWQKAFWKVRADTKQMAILYAERHFPMVDLLPTERSRKPHDGMADALLIAEYNRRHANGLLT
jgi:Holliday junction resolvasome RuvABC endonuclease subunit